MYLHTQYLCTFWHSSSDSSCISHQSNGRASSAGYLSASACLTLQLLLQAVHSFFKQGSPLPSLATATVTHSGVSDYGGQPMSVIKVSYNSRGQKRKRDDSRARPGAARGRGSDGGRGSERGGQWGKEWPGGSKKYCRFALGKSNMDTQVQHSCVFPAKHLWGRCLTAKRMPCLCDSSARSEVE